MRHRLLLASSMIALPLAYLSATRLQRPPVTPVATSVSQAPLPDLGAMPELTGGGEWMNSAPISRADLAGKVVMIEIWTYGCGNCRNAMPHIVATAARHKAAGLVTIGVHTPEFEHEKAPANLRQRMQQMGVTFPVVMDNDFKIWKAFDNRYWPAVYIVDRKGRIRFHHDGEGRYDEIDSAVRTLLAER